MQPASSAALGLATEAAEKTSAVMREVYKTAQPIPRAGLTTTSRMRRCFWRVTNRASSTATTWSWTRHHRRRNWSQQQQGYVALRKRSISIRVDTVIASEAKQSRIFPRRQPGCFVASLLAMTTEKEIVMFATSHSPSRPDIRPLFLATIAGLACAFAIGKTLPLVTSAVSAAIEPLCMSASGSTLDVVEPIGSMRCRTCRASASPSCACSMVPAASPGRISTRLGHGLYHQGRDPLAAWRRSRGNLQGRQSFFEPPGTMHMVSANASATEPAELIAVFVADEGAQLTTFLD